MITYSKNPRLIYCSVHKMFHFCMDKHDFKLKLIMDIFIKPMDFAKFHKKGCIRMRFLRFPQYFVVIINTYTTFIVCDING